MANEILKEEIKNNINEIKKRLFIILPILLKRYYFHNSKRTKDVSYPEYNNYWETFWEKKDIFRIDLSMLYYDKSIEKMSPFDYRNECTIKIIAKKIKYNKIKKVCEIGSGAGLNLLLLAPLFPDVSFIGIEPTENGVKITNKLINTPPTEFAKANKLGKLTNVKVIKGSILDNNIIKKIQEEQVDLIYTTAVLEQLYNYIDNAIDNIINSTNKYFLFYEEWLEANYLIDNYITLVKSDYFRLSWNYLNKKQNVKIIEKSIPAIQPSWLKYGVVFGEKINDK